MWTDKPWHLCYQTFLKRIRIRYNIPRGGKKKERERIFLWGGEGGGGGGGKQKQWPKHKVGFIFKFKK